MPQSGRLNAERLYQWSGSIYIDDLQSLRFNEPAGGRSFPGWWFSVGVKLQDWQCLSRFGEEHYAQ